MSWVIGISLSTACRLARPNFPHAFVPFSNSFCASFSCFSKASTPRHDRTGHPCQCSQWAICGSTNQQWCALALLLTKTFSPLASSTPVDKFSLHVLLDVYHLRSGNTPCSKQGTPTCGNDSSPSFQVSSQSYPTCPGLHLQAASRIHRTPRVRGEKLQLLWCPALSSICVCPTRYKRDHTAYLDVPGS